MIKRLIKSPIQRVIKSALSPLPDSAGITSIADLFANGEYGAWFDLSDASTLYQDSGATTAVSSNGDPIGRVNDKSGNTANALQTVSAARPTYNSSNQSADLDLVDDNMIVTLSNPVAGTMIIKLATGYVVGKISASGSWSFTVNPVYFPTPNIEQVVIIDRDLTGDEISQVKGLMGADAAFASITSMNLWFRARSDLTTLDVSNWDTSNVTNFRFFAGDCSSLTTLDVSNWNTSNVTNFRFFARNCSL
ncbi:MAG: BspA family leucine-rich repeat surface protein, partial [Planctomycetes bacterium]|nr:BspA family leucine-rich repeat surface protein [Planctomycetota bacterium]